MCDNCLVKNVAEKQQVIPQNEPLVRFDMQEPASENEEYRKRRPKLWELELDLHCSIIGTCVPSIKLRKIYEKVSSSRSDHLSDYQLHNLFVSSAERPQVGIKMLHKYLEKTYAGAIARSKNLKTEEELEKFWNDCVKNGEIAAGYWSVMTHQHVTSELGNKVFGAVHMFSHLAGRKLQAETVKNKTSRQEVVELKSLLADKESAVLKLQKKLSAHEVDLSEMRLLLHNEQQSNNDYKQRLETLTSTSALTKANKQIKDLEKKLHDYENQQRIERETSVDDPRLDADLRSPIAEAQQCAESQNGAIPSTSSDTNDLPMYSEMDNDLCGRCVLYVGGQSGNQSNFREIVETRNGTFLYHDGGREDSRQRLTTMLGKADAVICPVSCVSHSATHKIKKICTRKEKKMIWIKSPSLAAFNTALHEVKQEGPVGIVK